jgi:hypothetical protein
VLEAYDGAQEMHFVGPNNFWPDDTRHTSALIVGGTTAGLKTVQHPINGVYCMSGPLVDAVYPGYMADGKFSAECVSRPDDVALADVVHSAANVTLHVRNEFHHQHSVNYKLPFFRPSTLFKGGAASLYGFGDLPLLHAILQGSLGDVHTSGDAWWRAVANLSVVSPKKPRLAALGFNFCRRVNPPPSTTRQKTRKSGGDGRGRRDDADSVGRHQWCGPPVRLLNALEPLCESRRTYRNLHPTHGFTDADHDSCPHTSPSVPQSVGSPATQETARDASKALTAACVSRHSSRSLHQCT